MRWKCKQFGELSNRELLDIMILRSRVFVVEQNCVYQDPDSYDRVASHLMAWDGELLTAYCRIVPAGLKHSEASIGRVVSHNSYRRKGLGRELMLRAIDVCRERYPDQDIKISAQQYLDEFYTGLGFHRCSEPYLEDGIPHIEMLFRYHLR